MANLKRLYLFIIYLLSFVVVFVTCCYFVLIIVDSAIMVSPYNIQGKKTIL